MKKINKKSYIHIINLFFVFVTLSVLFTGCLLEGDLNERLSGHSDNKWDLKWPKELEDTVWETEEYYISFIGWGRVGVTLNINVPSPYYDYELVGIKGKALKVKGHDLNNLGSIHILCTDYTLSNNNQTLRLTGGDSIFQLIMDKNFYKTPIH